MAVPGEAFDKRALAIVSAGSGSCTARRCRYACSEDKEVNKLRGI